MAGMWIKMRHDLIDAPDVRRIARALGLDRDQVYGKLFRLWSWADRHGKNGVIDAEAEDVDEQVGHEGFATALVSVGWLGTEGGIVIPHWDRHNSDSAKVRSLAQTRMRRARCAASATDCAHPVAQDASPEERRGEENSPPLPACAELPEARATLRAAWTAASKAGHVKAWAASRLPDGADALLGTPGWLEDALAAIDRLKGCKYFDSPASLHQLCLPGFVAKVLGGQYDGPKAGKRAGGPPRPDDKPPPREWTGADEEARKRMLAELKAKQREAVA